MTQILAWFFLCLFSSMLLSCSSMNDCCHNHYAICKELKRRIVMYGNVPDRILMTQQNAELPRLLKAYHDEGC